MMAEATAVALFLGILTALIGRLEPPYQSAVWCSLVVDSIGLWIIGVSIQANLLTGLTSGLALHVLFAFSFVMASFAMEHVADLAAKRRLS
jgi:hypothetical protein